MNATELLQNYKDQHVRLVCGSRWLVYDDSKWAVYEQKYRHRVHCVTTTDNEADAIATLTAEE